MRVRSSLCGLLLGSTNAEVCHFCVLIIRRARDCIEHLVFCTAAKWLLPMRCSSGRPARVPVVHFFLLLLDGRRNRFAQFLIGQCIHHLLCGIGCVCALRYLILGGHIPVHGREASVCIVDFSVAVARLAARACVCVLRRGTCLSHGGSCMHRWLCVMCVCAEVAPACTVFQSSWLAQVWTAPFVVSLWSPLHFAGCLVTGPCV